jgi:hypothetical protein
MLWLRKRCSGIGEDEGVAPSKAPSAAALEALFAPWALDTDTLALGSWLSAGWQEGVPGTFDSAVSLSLRGVSESELPQMLAFLAQEATAPCGDRSRVIAAQAQSKWSSDIGLPDEERKAE